MDTKKIPAYFDDGEKGFERIGYGKDLLIRYFPDRLEILGFGTGEVPEGKNSENYNVLVFEIPEELKEVFLIDVKGRTGYKGKITFLQDDPGSLKEIQI